MKSMTYFVKIMSFNLKFIAALSLTKQKILLILIHSTEM